jgi:UDP-GlcNAc:undecaprenyl-phosphate/decaprenyl-phosphate GlcNAc-1-phosphate transferase
MTQSIQPYLPIIIAAGLLAFLATPLTRLLARRLGMLDQPGLRKAHRLPVPLLGGLAMYVGLAVAFLAFGSRAWLAEGVAIMAGATLLFVAGLLDDRAGLPVWLKFAAQIAAGVLVLAAVHGQHGWPGGRHHCGGRHLLLCPGGAGGAGPGG